MASCDIKRNIKSPVLGYCYRACLQRHIERTVAMEEELEADIRDNSRPSTSGKFVTLKAVHFRTLSAWN